MFWRKKKEESLPLEKLAWNLMFTATDPDKNWEVASNFRKTDVPGNAVTCEVSFLMGSICRDIIRKAVRLELQDSAILSAEKAYKKTFEDESSEELPPEMRAVYGTSLLIEVATTALANYGTDSDFLPITLHTFVSRIHGDPRMISEIKPLIEERLNALQSAFKELLVLHRFRCEFSFTPAECSFTN